MTELKSTECVVVVIFLWIISLAAGDNDTVCIYGDSCILPCSFQGSSEEIIQWLYITHRKETMVHMYYAKKDQLSGQDELFKGRTSLFHNQLSKGNASLLLEHVKVQDQGEYKCYTSTIIGKKETFINLQVDAPVSKVDIQQTENTVICSSEGIYPEPQLKWTTNSQAQIHPTTTTNKSQDLYTITSVLTLSDSNLDYTCTVSNRRNKLDATLKQLNPITYFAKADVSVSCTTSNIPLTGFNLTWLFNHSQTIGNRFEALGPFSASEKWKKHVKGVSESGGLSLESLSSEHEGTYTCRLSDAHETHITNTILRMGEEKTDPTSVIVGIVVPLVIVLFAVVAFCAWKNRPAKRNNSG